MNYKGRESNQIQGELNEADLASVLAPALVNLAKGALPDEVDDMVILYPHLAKP